MKTQEALAMALELEKAIPFIASEMMKLNPLSITNPENMAGLKTEDALALALALEVAIPFFKANPEIIAGLGAPSPNLYQLLGDEFCSYVEWKEFDSWGLEGLNKSVPLTQHGITLNVDELYDEEDMPIDDDCDEPYDFFMPTLQAQLAPHHLQLVEICSLEGNVTVAQENPRLVCVRTAQGCLEELNALLRTVGFVLA